MEIYNPKTMEIFDVPTTKIDLRYVDFIRETVFGRMNGNSIQVDVHGSIAVEVKSGNVETLSSLTSDNNNLWKQLKAHKHYNVSIVICTKNINDIKNKKSLLRKKLCIQNSFLMNVLPRKNLLDEICDEGCNQFALNSKTELEQNDRKWLNSWLDWKTMPKVVKRENLNYRFNLDKRKLEILFKHFFTESNFRKKITKKYIEINNIEISRKRLKKNIRKNVISVRNNNTKLQEILNNVSNNPLYSSVNSSVNSLVESYKDKNNQKNNINKQYKKDRKEHNLNKKNIKKEINKDIKTNMAGIFAENIVDCVFSPLGKKSKQIKHVIDDE